MPKSSPILTASAFEAALKELMSLIHSLATSILDVEMRRKMLRERLAAGRIDETLRHFLATTSPEALRPKRFLFPAAVSATVFKVEERAWVARGLQAGDRTLRKDLIEELIAQGCGETRLIIRAVVEELGSVNRLPADDQARNARLIDHLSGLGPNLLAIAEQLFAIAEDPKEKGNLRRVSAALLGDPMFQDDEEVRPQPPRGFDPADLRGLRVDLLGDRGSVIGTRLVRDPDAARGPISPLQMQNEFQSNRIYDNAHDSSQKQYISLESASTDKEKESEDLNQSAALLVARGSAGGSYREIASGLDRVREAVSRSAARRLEVAIKAELPSKEFATFEDKKNVAHWLNDELRRFDLAIGSPKTGQPARIKVATGRTAPNGFIQIVTDLGEGRWSTTNCSTILDLVKVIAFVDAPMRREGLKDWRGRVSSESESTKRGGTPG